MSEPTLPEIPPQIGPFKLVAEVGKGGFATVYCAEDTRLHRDVALKLLHAHLAGNATLVQRFLGEARAASRTRHPNIVTIYDVGETDDGRPYLVMELLEGTILSKLIAEPEHQRQPLRAAAIVAQLASAVDYLHQCGIVHRDLKPSNVMVGDGGRVTLMDFGLARSLDDEDHLTVPGQFLGTPTYIAPEQVTGEGVGAAADIYALGVLTYELYSGRPPFVGDTLRVLHAHVYDPPPALESLRPGLPAGIYRAVALALAKNPRERPASAGEFARMISAASAPSEAPTAVYLPDQTATMTLIDADTTLVLPARQTPVPPAPHATPIPAKPAAPLPVAAATIAQGQGRRLAIALAGAALIAVLLAALTIGILKLRGGGSKAPAAATEQATSVPATAVAATTAVAGTAAPAVVAPPVSATLQPTARAAPSPVFGVSSLAGSADAGFADGTGSAARFSSPTDVSVDGAGNVYVADSENNRIRKITPDGAVTTLAGSGDKGLVDGRGAAAQFNDPTGLVADAAGNVYVADTFNHRIRKITPDGVVTTFVGSGQSGLGGGGFADGPAAAAQFREPTGIAIDGAGNLYVADKGNHRIRKISPAGDVTTLAGSGAAGAAAGGFTDGPAASARFNSPGAVAVDAAGNVYVVDTFNQRIRKISPAGVVSTLAGSGEQGVVNGSDAVARFRNPSGIAVGPAGNIFVADSSNQVIRKIGLAGEVSTLAGSGKEGFADGAAASAEFDFPQGLALDGAGNLYVADTHNQRIRKIALTPAAR